VKYIFISTPRVKGVDGMRQPAGCPWLTRLPEKWIPMQNRSGHLSGLPTTRPSEIYWLKFGHFLLVR
jgi:hypothetical protein